jgi:hypothetical protein
MPNQHVEDDINFWEGRQLNKFVKHLQIYEDPIDGHNGEEVVAATNTAPWPKHHDHESRPLPTVTNQGRFTLWPSKSRGRAIEWPNFVESPKK